MMRAILTWLFCGCLALRAAEVTAELSTNVVEAGRGAILSIQVQGGMPDAAPSIPRVKDLIVNPGGQTQQMRIVNGRMNRSVGFRFTVGSHVAGEYEIPSIVVKVNGQELRTEPLKLTVRPDASGEPGDMGSDAGAPDEEAEHGYLTFQMVKKDRKHLYPGEIAPVRIQAYFPYDARVSLNGPPRPEGSAFTLHNLSEEPRQNMEVVNGKRYRVLTWYGGLSATKAGRYPADFALEGTVAVPDRNARRRPSPFDDPFFGRSMLDDLFTQWVEKDLSFRVEEPPEVEVTELPSEGRPEDFSGAIGQFEFESVRLPREMRTGEPVRIEARVKGAGNFTLLRQPEPIPADEWKTYDGEGEFTPGDAASFGGTKDFSYNAVPRTPGVKEVRLGFSYFDPDAGEYRHVESAPEEVEITGQALAEAPSASAGGPTSPEAPQEPRLAPIRREPGALRAYEPLTREPWFAPVAGGCGLLSLGLLGWGVWRERHEEPGRAARRASLAAEARALAAADDAVARGDAPAFFVAAREALRLRLAGRGELRPEAVTLADLPDRIDPRLLELWQWADRLDYSGEPGDVGALETWHAALQRGIETLSEERHAA